MNTDFYRDRLRAIRARNEVSVAIRRGSTSLSAQLMRIEMAGPRGARLQSTARLKIGCTRIVEMETAYPATRFEARAVVQRTGRTAVLLEPEVQQRPHRPQFELLPIIIIDLLQRRAHEAPVRATRVYRRDGRIIHSR